MPTGLLDSPVSAPSTGDIPDGINTALTPGFRAHGPPQLTRLCALHR
jgi:hypothetical protein